MSINFSNCTWIVAIPSLAISTSINSLYYKITGCSSLLSINVSGWDTSNVTNMTGLFQNCTSLQSLDVSGWDTSKVTDMSSVFNGCNSLLSINVSGWDTSNVTNMSGMFKKCYSLQSIDISSWNTSNVTNMSGMFDNSYNVSKLLLPTSFKMDSISSVNNLLNLGSCYKCSTDFNTIKSVFDSIIATTTALSSPSFTFATNSAVTDDEDGTLQTLLDSCTAKGWTIKNLTIYAYGS